MDILPPSNLVYGGNLTYRIIGLAMGVHRRLGSGLLESVYDTCLCYELNRNDIAFQRQVPLSVVYDEVCLQSACIADIIVADKVVLELKAVEALLPVHQAQLLNYMRLSSCRIGLLINFNTVSLTRSSVLDFTLTH